MKKFQSFCLYSLSRVLKVNFNKRYVERLLDDKERRVCLGLLQDTEVLASIPQMDAQSRRRGRVQG